MDTKAVRWVIIVASGALLIIGLFIFITDIIFIVTKKEADANIISIKNNSGKLIVLEYYNDYKLKSVTTTIKAKNLTLIGSPEIGETIKIFYSKLFPKNVYGKNKEPGFSILLMEIVFLILMMIAIQYGIDGVRNKIKGSVSGGSAIN